MNIRTGGDESERICKNKRIFAVGEYVKLIGTGTKYQEMVIKKENSLAKVRFHGAN